MPSGGAYEFGGENANPFSSGTVSARPIGVNAPMTSTQAAAAGKLIVALNSLGHRQETTASAGDVAEIRPTSTSSGRNWAKFSRNQRRSKSTISGNER